MALSAVFDCTLIHVYLNSL